MRDWLSEGADLDDIDSELFADDDQEWASWEHVHGLWLAHDKQCNCGRQITLDDAYYFGTCDVCRKTSQIVPF